ncbi:hypothetical protein V6B33_20525, partial [Mangrovibacillus sp. Mu-81]|uniref:hypothetical protein n=1 Tax=Mangrovibacillus sp. Mu-81 TaxID=3121478 RepID=UPI002FE4DDDD
SAFMAALPYACRLWASRLRFSICPAPAARPSRSKAKWSKKAKKRLLSPFILCLSGLSEPPPHFFDFSLHIQLLFFPSSIFFREYLLYFA